ncbi:MAG TPA: winged helix-turn-helix transcriptional regulator [Thermodesulfobacteriota bacterium]|nr:winged helix-turn-helix transcriptional regulator [Thermodesulfobacteriota bacterium]
MELRIEPKGESTVSILRCKWTILILMKMAEGLSRPSEIRKAIPGISIKVLNERLRRLEREGVIKRRAFSGYPLRVEYHLSVAGRRLKPIVRELGEMGIPVAEVAEVIDCKWMIRILSVLKGAPKRTNQIKRSVIGISNKVLSERLRKLENMGFIRREIIDATPPGVSYSLTEWGDRLIGFIETRAKGCL